MTRKPLELDNSIFLLIILHLFAQNTKKKKIASIAAFILPLLT